jgi:hypothetical protein
MLGRRPLLGVKRTCPLGNETRAWLDFLSTGRASVHATPEQAMLNLKATYAIERAVATGQAVRLD